MLRCGCVQEEIRFTLSPELIVSMLIMDQMEDNEAIVIQVSHAVGLASNTRGAHQSSCSPHVCRALSAAPTIEAMGRHLPSLESAMTTHR